METFDLRVKYGKHGFIWSLIGQILKGFTNKKYKFIWKEQNEKYWLGRVTLFVLKFIYEDLSNV